MIIRCNNQNKLYSTKRTAFLGYIIVFVSVLFYSMIAQIIILAFPINVLARGAASRAGAGKGGRPST